jgi:hypothetical protein
MSFLNFFQLKFFSQKSVLRIRDVYTGSQKVVVRYRYFLPKKLSLSSQKMGVGSGIREKPIPDPGVKKAPDP